MTVPGLNGGTTPTHPSKSDRCRINVLFILIQKLVPQHLLSRLVGWVAASETVWIKRTFINWAIQRYQVDMTDAAEPNPNAYASFNAFFTRALKSNVRPIDGPFCSPADGMVSECGAIRSGQILQAKGIDYSVSQLMAGGDETPYLNGTFSTIYLSPRDYHRVHCPINGRLTAARYVPGKLFSVNQQTADHIPGLFAINERLVMEFESDTGPFCVVMVGAMIVAGIQSVWREAPYPPAALLHESINPTNFVAGQELGRFFMGSTAIVLTTGQHQLKHRAGDTVKMGESMI